MEKIVYKLKKQNSCQIKWKYMLIANFISNFFGENTTAFLIVLLATLISFRCLFMTFFASRKVACRWLSGKWRAMHKREWIIMWICRTLSTQTMKLSYLKAKNFPGTKKKTKIPSAFSDICLIFLRKSQMPSPTENHDLTQIRLTTPWPSEWSIGDLIARARKNRRKKSKRFPFMKMNNGKICVPRSQQPSRINSDAHSAKRPSNHSMSIREFV